MSEKLGHFVTESDNCSISPKALSAFSQGFQTPKNKGKDGGFETVVQELKVENQQLKENADEMKILADKWRGAAQRAQAQLTEKNKQIQALQAKNKQYEDRITQLVSSMDKLQLMVTKYCDLKKGQAFGEGDQFKPFKIKQNHQILLQSSPNKLSHGFNKSRFGNGYTGYNGYTSTIPGLSIPGISSLSYKAKVDGKYNSSYSYRPREENANVIGFRKKDYDLPAELTAYKRQKMLETQTVEGVMRIQKCFSNFRS